MLIAAVSLALILQSAPSIKVEVKTSDELKTALEKAKPGTEIVLAPGEYLGGMHVRNVHGAPGKPIVVRSASGRDKSYFRGGGSAIQFSHVSYLELHNLEISLPEGNGINIDDGGNPNTPSRHILIRSSRIIGVPKGNHDAIKLSGVQDFRVEGGFFDKWGGSAIDMVGCHRGEIAGGMFYNGGDSGVQAKGGSTDIVISESIFFGSAQRAVNIGGSTGRQFFRPPLDKVPAGKRFEARNVRVEGCRFMNEMAPICFVGVDGAIVRFNTFHNPLKWVIRILQETSTNDFVACRNGVFEDNLVQFTTLQWSSGGVNIGAGTSPQTFQFARNFWYCINRPANSKPNLPTREKDGVYEQDPLLKAVDVVQGNPPQNAAAQKVGASAYKRK